MLFNSFTFAVFFALVCGATALTQLPAFQKLPREKRLCLRHILLLLASYVFYGWWNWRCCFLMLFLTLTAHVSALQMEKPWRKAALAVGVAVPLLVLGVFKYFNFFVDSFCALFGIMRAGTLRILLPVGISFYTFQSLSYTIDVSRGKLAPERDFVRTALYIAFFPQLVAGPIVKAGEFLPQLREERLVTLSGLEQGVQIFVFGLFKKIVLADNISSFVDTVHRAPGAYSAATLLLMAYAYFVQLYCDFSGYSDMAVGCAKCLGYDLPRNFNLPFISPNVAEFWRRWHISLSTWLTEYLYFPLGGSRKGEARTCLNLMIIMTVCGLWHGAAWTFVLWGALLGAAQCLYRMSAPLRRRLPKGPVFTAVYVFLTFTFICLSAVIFRASSIGQAWRIFVYIFTLHPGIHYLSFWGVFGLALTWGAHLIACARSRRLGEAPTGYYPTVSLDRFWGLLAFFCFAGLTLALGYTGQSPFIYFQF